MPNLWIVFTTGLLTGGVTCLAVQGGMLATAIAARNSKHGAIAGFLTAKLIVYTLLGFGLGALGSVFLLSPRVMGILQLVAALYMLGVAGAILEIHPIFRYFILQTPRFFTRFVRRESKSSQLFAPIFLGLLTVLIPCGTTQAIMAQAVTAGTALGGALTMGVFILGTIPLFVLFGFGFAGLGSIGKGRMAKVSALLVLGVGLFNINSSAIVLGSPVYAQKLARQVYCTLAFCPKNLLPPTAVVHVTIQDSGYVIDNPVIEAGRPTTLKLSNLNGSGCQQAFTIPALNVSKIVGIGKSDEISFVAPDKPGTLAYSCGMGMYPGEFTVVN